jgi:homoserine kinase type II
VTCLPGEPVLEPSPEHCAQVGEVLADLHLSGQSYRGHLDNLRGHNWWSAVAPEIYPFLSADNVELLRSEIEFQAAVPRSNLPRGVVHADLFRDNVLFNGEAVGGFIDFYFACVDSLVYDVAITVNDWCTAADCSLDTARTQALLTAYQSVRPFTREETQAWPAMLRAGALRFWVSRLYDYYLPRPGELTHAHDPERFRGILLFHRSAAARLRASA